MARPTRGELGPTTAADAAGTAFGGGGGTLLGLLFGPAASSQKLPLDGALRQGLLAKGYRSVSVDWLSPHAISVYASHGTNIFRFDAKCPPHLDPEARLDHLYDQIMDTAGRVRHG